MVRRRSVSIGSKFEKSLIIRPEQTSLGLTGPRPDRTIAVAGVSG
jgi:hypothetical protein